MNCELIFPAIQWTPQLKLLFDNLFIFTRRLHEKYISVGNRPILNLLYTRVDNYNQTDTIFSVISSLSHPKLELTPDMILDILQTQFDLSHQSAKEIYDQWWSQAQPKLAENKKYYTSVNTLEPGVEMNIIQSSSTNETIVELYEVTSSINSIGF